MKDREYKDAWQELKDTLMRTYVVQSRNKSDYYVVIKHQTFRNILRKMEELDGTNEFSNLLRDVEEE